MTDKHTWTDSHCHFDFAEFDEDRDAVWARCNAAGIVQMLVPGVAPEQWQALSRFSNRYAGIYHAVGLHPWWIAANRHFNADALKNMVGSAAGDRNCIAIGECGLDATIDTPMPDQEAYLRPHLEAACELELPLLLHCVRAHNPLIRLLKAYKSPAGGVIHAFSGSVEIAKTYWDMGFYLGVGGTITYPRASKTRHTVAQRPLESLLLETDAPSMPLCGRQGHRNSPENLPLIAQCLAELKGEPLQRVAAVTTRNFQVLFRDSLLSADTAQPRGQPQ